jgi:DNA-directed RNA polymerase specialized sigma24 family protein
MLGSPKTPPGRRSAIRTYSGQERQDRSEQEALLAGLVGRALLVVLDRFSSVERRAFVLDDLFDLSFDEIAPIVGRASKGTRQLGTLASR